MLSYYLFMALLIATLVVWAIIALREDPSQDLPGSGNDGPETDRHED